MPLPFKKDDPIFPDNRLPVYHRTKITHERLKARKDKLKQCLASMEKSLSNDHVETVPESELATRKPGKIWYAPVFSVTEKRKNNSDLRLTDLQFTVTQASIWNSYKALILTTSSERCFSISVGSKLVSQPT